MPDFFNFFSQRTPLAVGNPISNENSKNYFFRWDFLTVYDGNSNTSPMMGKYCGNSIPPSHVSSSNEILINFHSDQTEAGAGFQMEYSPTNSSSNSSLQPGNPYLLKVALMSGDLGQK